jgi:hypothetical protein
MICGSSARQITSPAPARQSASQKGSYQAEPALPDRTMAVRPHHSGSGPRGAPMHFPKCRPRRWPRDPDPSSGDSGLKRNRQNRPHSTRLDGANLILWQGLGRLPEIGQPTSNPWSEHVSPTPSQSRHTRQRIKVFSNGYGSFPEIFHPMGRNLKKSPEGGVALGSTLVRLSVGPRNFQLLPA